MISLFYLIGCIVSFVMLIIEWFKEDSKGNDCSEAPAAIAILTLLSWFYPGCRLYYHFIK